MQKSEVRPRLPSPQGLNVLLVSTDDDIHACINNQLSHPHYQVAIFLTCNSALRFLKNDNIDLVLSDFSLKDMDGYEFINQVQNLKKNIPHVVIFEAEGSGHEISMAYKLGACYILRKPLSEASDEIRNLWQHVFRWRAQNEVSSQQESLKRGTEFMNHGEEPSSNKRQRFVWTPERHALFVQVVKQLGKDAVPKNILLAMNEPGLTREIVGSHLQKHRENEKKREREKIELRERHIKNDILASPGVSSSLYPDMSHLYLLEASTSNSPPPPRAQMQRHRYNLEHLASLGQIQYRLPDHNFGVTQLMGNGVSNMTSFTHQPSHSSNGRRDGNQAPGTSQNPSSGSGIINNNRDSFESKEGNILQNSGLGSSPHGTSIRGANQSQSNQNQDSGFPSHSTSNILLQLDQNSCLGSSYHDATIGFSNQSNQSNQNQGVVIGTQQLDRANQNQGVGIGMQQLDQNSSSGSGNVMQPQPITHPLDQEDSLGAEFGQGDYFDVDELFAR